MEKVVIDEENSEGVKGGNGTSKKVKKESRKEVNNNIVGEEEVEENGEKEEDEKKKDNIALGGNVTTPISGSSSSASPSSSNPVSPDIGGGGGMCTGDVCSIDSFGGGASDAETSNFLGSNPSSSTSAPAPSSNSFSAPSGGGGGGCNGDVCSISFDDGPSPSSFESTTSTSSSGGGVSGGKQAWNPFEDPRQKPNPFGSEPPKIDEIQECVNDVCTQVVQEQVEREQRGDGDCTNTIGGTCEKTEPFSIRFGRVIETTRQSFISQIFLFHVSFLNALSRQFAEHLVYIDERCFLLRKKEEGSSFRKFFKDLMFRTLYSTFFLVFIKCVYDLFVESMVQFCCGGPVKKFIPRLDRVMGFVTIFSAMRNCEEEGKFYCFCRGVKDVMKTFLIVLIISNFSGVSPFLMGFFSTLVVSGLERLLWVVFVRRIWEKRKKEKVN